ncbi:MAG: serine/threonine-protein kinase [Proteobacteria bacterium]|nr:serine/threonine-protein kinase [Pseudomonadota bacterium]
MEIGEVIDGRYKILELIAEGGMGSVYLAEHWLIKRRVAIKMLHRELATDADMLRRFMNEALAAGTLGHPHIVESTDMGFTRAKVPYIVFEYVEGTLLADEIRRLHGLPIRRALRIARQIASALAAAHAASIIHRDLKSDNVLLAARPTTDHVKVLDFGISRFLKAHDHTLVGKNLVGTPEFMAPEQILTPDRVDERCDIYALGVVLFEMLAGDLPFMLRAGAKAPRKGHVLDLDATHALLHRIVHDPAPPLVRPDAPPELASMLAQLLAKDPAARFQTMTEVQEALDAIVGALRSSAPSIPSPQASDPRARHTMADTTISGQHLLPDAVEREVKMLGKRWSLDGSELRLALRSPALVNLATVVAYAAALADELEHYPTIVIEVPRLTLAIRAYDRDRIAVIDLIFAARLEQWLRDTAWVE